VFRAWGLAIAGAWCAVSAMGQPTRVPIDVSKLGPQVGELAPEFRLTDQKGAVWTRESFLGPKGGMLVFVRSADW
jgi:hypothetical protein